jgi:putative spermidine/putrescine transport system substrate-binding protein
VNQGVDTTVLWTATPLLALNSEVIMPGAPNLDAVQALAAFCAQPDRQAEFAIQTNYGPPSNAAFDFMTEEQAANLPNSPGRASASFDVEWLAANAALQADEYLDLFAG